MTTCQISKAEDLAKVALSYIRVLSHSIGGVVIDILSTNFLIWHSKLKTFGSLRRSLLPNYTLRDLLTLVYLRLLFPS